MLERNYKFAIFRSQLVYFFFVDFMGHIITETIFRPTFGSNQVQNCIKS